MLSRLVAQELHFGPPSAKGYATGPIIARFGQAANCRLTPIKEECAASTLGPQAAALSLVRLHQVPGEQLLHCEPR